MALCSEGIHRASKDNARTIVKQRLAEFFEWKLLSMHHPLTHTTMMAACALVVLAKAVAAVTTLCRCACRCRLGVNRSMNAMA